MSKEDNSAAVRCALQSALLHGERVTALKRDLDDWLKEKGLNLEVMLELYLVDSVDTRAACLGAQVEPPTAKPHSVLFNSVTEAAKHLRSTCGLTKEPSPAKILAVLAGGFGGKPTTALSLYNKYKDQYAETDQFNAVEDGEAKRFRAFRADLYKLKSRELIERSDETRDASQQIVYLTELCKYDIAQEGIYGTWRKWCSEAIDIVSKRDPERAKKIIERRNTPRDQQTAGLFPPENA